MEGHTLTFGLPRMHEEAGERRDFLPDLVRTVTDLGVRTFVESGIGSGMGYSDLDYLAVSPLVEAVDEGAPYAQDVVLVLRSPDERFGLLRRGATLISMLHFPTRPERVHLLRSLGLEAVSLDSIEDDRGQRLVEDAAAVAWNGVEAAFDALEDTYPRFWDPDRPPIHVVVMGCGNVGRHAVEAATKYGSLDRQRLLFEKGGDGVEVTAIGRNLTGREGRMRQLLARADIVVDASARDDTSRPLIPNGWLAELPDHAVICDLVVDPYLLRDDPATVRSIEGIPRGNLDRYVLGSDDPAWETTIPPEIPHDVRRVVVSCYSWPGVYPKPCMELYGTQLDPLLRALIRAGGVAGLRPDGEFHERALYRATLWGWHG